LHRGTPAPVVHIGLDGLGSAPGPITLGNEYGKPLPLHADGKSNF